MENRAHAIIVGIFTLILGLALFFTFWWLNGDKEKTTDYVIVSNLPVTGLSAEGAVKFRGVDVGKITSLTLNSAKQTSIVLRIQVIDTLHLSTDAYAQIRTQGVTGLAYIDLNDLDSDAPQLQPGASIPLRPSFMDKVMEKGPVMMAQFEKLMKNSSEVTATANDTIKRLDVDRLNQAIANLEKASTALGPALASVTNAGNRVSIMMSDRNQQQLHKTLASLQKTADTAQPALVELGETARAFKETADQIGISTQQLSDVLSHDTLPNLNQLMQSLNHDVRHFDQLIYMLEDEPQSLLLGKPQATPGPGEKGFDSGAAK